MYFLSCFVKAVAFSHCDLFMGVSWEGLESNWDIGLAERQTQIHPPELSLTLVRTKLLVSWSAWKPENALMSLCQDTRVLHIVSSGVSRNLNMHFNFVSSLWRGKVLLQAAINFSNAWWHWGICMASWGGRLTAVPSCPVSSTPFSLLFAPLGQLSCSELKNCVIQEKGALISSYIS